MSGTLAATTRQVDGTSQRVHSLDGLRGVGALVVVIHHALLIVPALARLYVAPAGGTLSTPPLGPAGWWLYATPLRLIWGGHEAVLVFFVLSGIVLTMPLLNRSMSGRQWLGYYLRRMCRLYVPVWASLVLAALWAEVVHRGPSASTWLASHPQPSPRLLAWDGFLLNGTSNLNSPLWSLQWEVLFSLLLPIMFAVLRLVRVTRWPVAAVGVLAVVAAVAQIPSFRHLLPRAYLTAGALQYLPIFAVGMIIAMCPERVQHLRAAVAGRGRAVWMVIGLLLAASPSYIGGGVAPVAFIYQLATVAGVAMLVLGVLTIPTVGRMLESRPIQYFGSRSFSIYLVHEPIIVSAAVLIHADGWWPWAAIAPVAILVAMLVAEGFYRVVERPATGLSRRIGRLTSSPSR